MADSANPPSTSNTDLFASPTKVMNSPKRRNLRVKGAQFKKPTATVKSSLLEASGSPLRKVSQPLYSSTPKPMSPKLESSTSSTQSNKGHQNFNPLPLKKRAVVVLDRTVVEEYFAKKKAEATNETNAIHPASPKKLSVQKRKSAERKPGRPPKGGKNANNNARKSAKGKVVARTASGTSEETTALERGPELGTDVEVEVEIEAEAEAEAEVEVEALSEDGNSIQPNVLARGPATTIPSDALKFLGVTSRQGRESPCSTITQPLSPTRDHERISSPEPNENTPTPVSSTYYSPTGASDTHSPHANEASDSRDVVPHATSALELTHISRNASAEETATTDKFQVPVPRPAGDGEEDKLTIGSHWDLLFGLTHRLFESPRVLQLHELKWGSKDVRRVAPYSLKIAEDEERFFLYAAVLSKVSEKYCCLLFDIVDEHLVAYGGHFMLTKERIYDPILKTPVQDVNPTKLAECRHHLCLFNVQNEKLLQYDGYFLQIRDPSYERLQGKFLDSFLNSLDQVALKETTRHEKHNESKNSVSNMGKVFPVTSALKDPRVEQVFFETCLSITQERMECILKFVCAMGNVKKRYGEFAVTQASCAFQSTFDTAYYAAHESGGCTSFYPTAYLLGRIEDSYVVGILIGQTFFIMATKRLYSRFDDLAVGLQSVVTNSELYEKIVLPLWLSHEQSLVMLEVRQILRQPSKHQEQFNELNRALKISGFRSKPFANSFLDMTSATQQKSHSLHNACLKQSLDSYFNASFLNATCKFPTHPACPENPQMFCENLLKLWMQRLQRETHHIAEPDILVSFGATSLSQLEFFTIDPVSFVEHFLSLFGLSENHTFRCLTLNSDGEPISVCQETVSATTVGKHVEDCHIHPLLWDDSNPMREFSFTPFTLVFRKCDNPPLSETCDFELLSWALSMAAKWSVEPKSSYVKFIQSLSPTQKSKSGSFEKTTSPGEKQKIRNKSSPSLPAVNKRKRSVDDIPDDELKRRCVNPNNENSNE